MKTTFSILLAASLLVGCGDGTSTSPAPPAPSQPAESTASTPVGTQLEQTVLPDYVTHFEPDSLAKPIELVSCEVNGADTMCLSVTLKNSPGGAFTVGPFCPNKITDTTDQGGLWLQSTSNTVHSVDGQFITRLAKLYDDTGWQMYDPETGEVFHTIGDQCQLAADPEPDPALANHCVECLVSDLDANLTTSYLIPLVPQKSTANTANNTGRPSRTKAGIAFSGALLEAPAPLDLIESNYNIAPLDKCGGHINPNIGYHIHAVTDDCLAEVTNETGHAAQIGIAMDGYPIFERSDASGEPTDLDQCRGHGADGAGHDLDAGYHYHVNDAGENQILPCLTGAVVGGEDDRGARGPGGPQGGGLPPGFEDAATKLDVSPDALFQAMQDAGGRNADLAKAAAALGITEDQLREALPARP